jgi:hypothetical protein
MQNELATIGHNKPPSEIEILREGLEERSEYIRNRADEILEAFSRAPTEIIDNDQCANSTDFAKQIQAIIKDVDRQRVAEKEPYLFKQRAVDAYFKPMLDKLGDIKSKIDDRITAFLNFQKGEKSAPQSRGDMAMSSLRTVVDFEIIDRKKIDLEALRPYLATSTIETAIRGAIRAGERTINGVRIFETQKAVTR